MPGGDRTGPMGMGPRTGRGAGYCGGAGFLSGIAGAVFGRGRGRGRGWRNMFYATGLPGWARAGMDITGAAIAANAADSATCQQEIDVLKQQAERAASVLEGIRQRISELEEKQQQ